MFCTRRQERSSVMKERPFKALYRRQLTEFGRDLLQFAYAPYERVVKRYPHSENHGHHIFNDPQQRQTSKCDELSTTKKSTNNQKVVQQFDESDPSVAKPNTSYDETESELKNDNSILSTSQKTVDESEYFYWLPEYPTVKFVRDEVLGWKGDNLDSELIDNNSDLTDSVGSQSKSSDFGTAKPLGNVSQTTTTEMRDLVTHNFFLYDLHPRFHCLPRVWTTDTEMECLRFDFSPGNVELKLFLHHNRYHIASLQPSSLNLLKVNDSKSPLTASPDYINQYSTSIANIITIHGGEHQELNNKIDTNHHSDFCSASTSSTHNCGRHSSAAGLATFALYAKLLSSLVRPRNINERESSGLLLRSRWIHNRAHNVVALQSNVELVRHSHWQQLSTKWYNLGLSRKIFRDVGEPYLQLLIGWLIMFELIVQLSSCRYDATNDYRKFKNWECMNGLWTTILPNFKYRRKVISNTIFVYLLSRTRTNIGLGNQLQ